MRSRRRGRSGPVSVPLLRPGRPDLGRRPERLLAVPDGAAAATAAAAAAAIVIVVVVVVVVVIVVVVVVVRRRVLPRSL